MRVQIPNIDSIFRKMQRRHYLEERKLRQANAYALPRYSSSGSLVRRTIPLRTLIASLNLETLPIHTIHRSHIQRLYASLLFHEFLLLLRQFIHNRLRRANCHRTNRHAAGLAKGSLIKLATKSVRRCIVFAEKQDLVFVGVYAGGCSLRVM